MGLSGTSTHLTRQLSGTHYWPLRHPSAPGLSLTGVRLIIPDHVWGFPCCVRFPCVHAAASTPVQRPGVILAHLTRPYQPSPIRRSGRPAHRPFRGLLGVHSRCGLHIRAVTKSSPLFEGFSHFVTSMTAPIASGGSESPGGACTHWKAPPCHGAHPKRSFGRVGVIGGPCPTGVIERAPIGSA